MLLSTSMTKTLKKHCWSEMAMRFWGLYVRTVDFGLLRPRFVLRPLLVLPWDKWYVNSSWKFKCSNDRVSRNPLLIARSGSALASTWAKVKTDDLPMHLYLSVFFFNLTKIWPLYSNGVGFCANRKLYSRVTEWKCMVYNNITCTTLFSLSLNESQLCKYCRVYGVLCLW